MPPTAHHPPPPRRGRSAVRRRPRTTGAGRALLTEMAFVIAVYGVVALLVIATDVGPYNPFVMDLNIATKP